MPSRPDAVFIVLQAYACIFLLLHDWVPLGRLNNLKAIRREDSMVRSILVTLIPVIPAAIGLYGSFEHFAAPYPAWLRIELWATYATLFAGLLRAWWIPYLLIPEPDRAARYQTIFAGNYTFLPRHNGIAPDTLHVTFHAAVLGTIVFLALRTFS